MIKSKKVGVLLLGLSLLLGSHNAVSAAEVIATQTLDNDHGAINSSYNARTGTWYHGSYSGSYNGDHRISSTSNPSYGEMYMWKFTARSGGRMLYAYLNHPNFTDPAAEYLVTEPSTAGGSAGWLVGTKNQNTAPGGWNKISSSLTYKDNYRYTAMTVVQSSGSASTGADGAMMEWWQ